jgi:hypothetical protein
MRSGDSDVCGSDGNDIKTFITSATQRDAAAQNSVVICVAYNKTCLSAYEQQDAICKHL